MTKKILIVEDNELNMKLFSDLLEAHSYETIQTRDGLEALDLAREHKPDLILMDIQLPEVSALESLVALRVDDARRLCERALKDRTPRATLRRAALAGLAALEDPDALDAIRRYARPGNPRHWRHDAIRAYGRLARQLDSRRAREAAARTLEAMLDDDWPRTRTTVIAALRALGEKRSIPALERVADADPLASVRRAARSAARAIESAARERTRIGEVERRLERLEHRLDAIDGKGDDED